MVKRRLGLINKVDVLYGNGTQIIYEIQLVWKEVVSGLAGKVFTIRNDEKCAHPPWSSGKVLCL